MAAATLDVLASRAIDPHLSSPLLLPPWMFLACPFVVSPSSCHHCFHLGCVLLAPLSSLPHLVTIAQRSCRLGWQRCYCHLGVFLLLVPLLTLILSPWLLPPWSCLASAIAEPHVAIIAPSWDCSHCCCHLGVFLLLVPFVDLHIVINVATTLDGSC